MPQMHLPFFPDGVEHITSELAFEKRDGQVTYFNGHMPVFIHDEQDIPTLRMITAQFCIKGTMPEAELHVIRARLIGGMLNKANPGGPVPLLGQSFALASVEAIRRTIFLSP